MKTCDIAIYLLVNRFGWSENCWVGIIKLKLTLFRFFRGKSFNLLLILRNRLSSLKSLKAISIFKPMSEKHSFRIWIDKVCMVKIRNNLCESIKFAFVITQSASQRSIIHCHPKSNHNKVLLKFQWPKKLIFFVYSLKKMKSIHFNSLSCLVLMCCKEIETDSGGVPTERMMVNVWCFVCCQCNFIDSMNEMAQKFGKRGFLLKCKMTSQ